RQSCRVVTTSAVVFFFFSSRRRHTRFSRDWSSDVCSSDLVSKIAEQYFPQSLFVDASQLIQTDSHFGSAHVNQPLSERKIQAFRSEERRVGKECRCRW